MNPEHLTRIEAVAALPLAARKALWTLTEVPGWAYWLESGWCKTCDGATHEREGRDALCVCGGDWPCTEPRCEACGGTGDAPEEWATGGLGLGTCVVALMQWHAAVVDDDEWFDGHLWCPYSALDVLCVAAKLRDDARWTLNVRVYDAAIEATVWGRGDAGGAWTATNDDPLLAALDVLGQITTESFDAPLRVEDSDA